ncbi:hypothetical protein PPACK8108_LOCUS10457 [Phakopsora pachyrhizi]|uniref:Uncharacterized protein n=1 Tax=Phakopsora pachyrhizi TaxID=170000 RepID=A0AAV0B0L8_PHAPC|nr:hypothetical protein PPACK8108_LOCUS10457 [Phakopsora pachyrhizi]
MGQGREVNRPVGREVVGPGLRVKREAYSMTKTADIKLSTKPSRIEVIGSMQKMEQGTDGAKEAGTMESQGSWDKQGGARDKRSEINKGSNLQILADARICQKQPAS